jgi:RNA polymerase sigma-54 factor
MKQSTEFNNWQKLELKSNINHNVILALKILQANNIELEQKISEELLENPLLELYADEDFKDENNFEEHLKDETNDSPDSFDITKNEIEDYYDDGTDTGYDYSVSDKDAGSVIEEVTIYEKTIQEHLSEQLTFLNLSDDEQIIAYSILSSINNQGYLTNSISDISNYNKISLKTAKKVLEIIQSLDPPGIAAANHRDCLLLQLKRKKLQESIPYQIINECYDLYIQKKFATILNQLQLSDIDFQKADKIIKELYLYPAQSFGSINENNYINPDVSYIKNNGEWHIIINDEHASKLKINKNLFNKWKKEKNPKLQLYLNLKVQSAKCIIKAISQRSSTLYNICHTILKIQIKYFETGDRNNLKTMSLNEIAQQLDLNDSTVSRALANKYADTPFGVIKLRNLISTGLKDDSTGQDVSRNSIIEQIKKMIIEEDKKSPLSDIEIYKILQSKGINVKRRTVAKYRAEAGILPKHHRKSFN